MKLGKSKNENDDMNMKVGKRYVIKKAGMMLTDDELEQVSGGCDNPEAHGKVVCYLCHTDEYLEHLGTSDWDTDVCEYKCTNPVHGEPLYFEMMFYR